MTAAPELRAALRESLKATEELYGEYNIWLGECLVWIDNAHDPADFFTSVSRAEEEWVNKTALAGRDLDARRSEIARSVSRDLSLAECAGELNLESEFAAAEAIVNEVLHRRVQLIRRVEAWRNAAADEIMKIDAARKLRVRYNPLHRGSKLDGRV